MADLISGAFAETDFRLGLGYGYGCAEDSGRGYGYGYAKDGEGGYGCARDSGEGYGNSIGNDCGFGSGISDSLGYGRSEGDGEGCGGGSYGAVYSDINSNSSRNSRSYASGESVFTAEFLSEFWIGAKNGWRRSKKHYS